MTFEFYLKFCWINAKNLSDISSVRWEYELKMTFKDPVKSAAVGLSILSLVLVAQRALRPGTGEELQDSLAELLMLV